jgi:hypothetical protein
MQIWTSSEAMADIDKPLNSARKNVERVLNAAVASKDYGAGVTKWALIYIIMDKDDPNFPEIRRYSKRTGLVEFRLKADHQAFKAGDRLAQRKLLAVAVLRSIEMSRALRIPDFDAESFQRDVLEALKKHDWA